MVVGGGRADGLDNKWQSDWTGPLGEINPGEILEQFRRLMTIPGGYDSSGIRYGLDRGSDNEPNSVNDNNQPSVGLLVTKTGAIIVQSMKMHSFRDKVA